MRRSLNGNVFIFVLFVSYFIFLLTNGIGNFRYGEKKALNFIQVKFSEIQDKYNYLIENMMCGDIEENNREILYLEEMREEILENVEKEGDFWLVDLKNLIKQKEDMLVKNFFENKDNSMDYTNYLKLKNEIDEYNLYYSLKQKPIDYSESSFIRYFIFIFNSRIHQIFLTIVILSTCFCMMKFNRHGYNGFFKTCFIIILPIFLIQVLNLIIWIIIDGSVDMLYPIRVIENFGIKYNDLENIVSDKIMPFYKIIIYTFLVEFIYIVFIVGFIKIVDLLFDSNYFKIGVVGIFFLGMIGLEFTKYSGISFLSYGKFFDVMRGYESIYKGGEFFSIYIFLIYLFIIMCVLSCVYFYKKYILNDKYI